MSAMASQIGGVSIVCSDICSGTDQRKRQSSASLAFYEGNPPVTGGFPSQRASKAKMFSCGDIIMNASNCLDQPNLSVLKCKYIFTIVPYNRCLLSYLNFMSEEYCTKRIFLAKCQSCGVYFIILEFSVASLNKLLSKQLSCRNWRCLTAHARDVTVMYPFWYLRKANYHLHIHCIFYDGAIPPRVMFELKRYYGQVSNIRRTLVGNYYVNYPDVVGALPVGAAPTASSLSIWHLASICFTKTTASRDEKHLSFWILCLLY